MRLKIRNLNFWDGTDRRARSRPSRDLRCRHRARCRLDLQMLEKPRSRSGLFSLVYSRSLIMVLLHIPSSFSFLITVVRSAGSRSLMTVVRSRSRSRSIAVAFTNGDASTHRADANTNFFSRRRRSQRRNGRDYQSAFHLNLLCLLR
jgi:hypothetical protein